LLTELANDLAYGIGALRTRKDRDRIDAELREREAQYRSLVENNMDGVLLTTPAGAILAANAVAQRILGYSEEELRRIGRKGLADETDPRLALALAERKKTGSFRGELTLIRKDGVKLPSEISSLVFTDINGREMTSMIVRDISERKRAEEQLRKLSCASPVTAARKSSARTRASCIRARRRRTPMPRCGARWPAGYRGKVSSSTSVRTVANTPNSPSSPRSASRTAVSRTMWR
jgi:PAS domain S-box-containing protein